MRNWCVEAVEDARRHGHRPHPHDEKRAAESTLTCMHYRSVYERCPDCAGIYDQGAE
jgi:hypothetical protein